MTIREATARHACRPVEGAAEPRPARSRERLVIADALTADLFLDWTQGPPTLDLLVFVIDGTIVSRSPTVLAPRERLPIHRRHLPRGERWSWFLRCLGGQVAARGLSATIELRRGRSEAKIELVSPTLLLPTSVVQRDGAVEVPFAVRLGPP